MLVNQLEQFCLSFTRKNVSYNGLTSYGVASCNNTLLWKTCLHAVYDQTIA